MDDLHQSKGEKPMNRRKEIGLAIVLIVGLQLSNTVAQSKKPESGQPNAEHMQHEMMNATPGPVHKSLARLVGDYTTVTKFFMQAGAPAAESTGSARISSALDGRFINEEDSGTFMGQPMKGFKILGYNNASKRYEGIWTYTMSTAMMTLGGESADGGKTIKLTGMFDDAGGAKQSLEVLMKLIDDSHFEVSLSARTPDGSAGPTLITTYTRKN